MMYLIIFAAIAARDLGHSNEKYLSVSNVILTNIGKIGRRLTTKNAKRDDALPAYCEGNPPAILTLAKGQ